MKRLGALLMVGGFVFALAETIYFGSNFFPQSGEERVCDLIAFLIVLAGSTLVYFADEKR